MVNTRVQYLARDKLYEREKPYSAEFEIEERNGICKTNYILSSQPVSVQAIKPTDKFDLDTHGFCVINASTNLGIYDALTRPQDVESAYIQQLETILHQHFPHYRRLEGIELVVCSLTTNIQALLMEFFSGEKTRRTIPLRRARYRIP